MIATWYVLEDGRVVDPAEVVVIGGRLMHGTTAVAMRRPDAPLTRSVDVIEERAKAAIAIAMESESEPAPRARGGYRTRVSKPE